MDTVKVVDSGRRGWKIINKADLKSTDVEYGSNESPAKEKPKRKSKAVSDGK